MTNPEPDELDATGQEETREKRAVGHGKPLPVYLQPAHITAVVAGYPEPVRAGVRWLADYCRDRCQSDHKLLAQHTQQARCSRSFSHLYTIFRGTHNFSGADSAENFLQLVLKMKSFAVASETAGDEILFGDFDLYGDFEQLLLSRRKPHIANRLVVQSGPTGSGKSELQKEFMRRHGERFAMARVEAATGPSLPQWQVMLRAALGISIGGRRDIRNEVIIENAKVFNYIFLDDCHRLYRESGASNQSCWNFIQRLHDETSAVVVVSITEVFARQILSLAYFAQFFGRGGGRGNLFAMPDFPEDDLILAVSKAYGLLDARRHLDELRQAAHGPERLRPLQDGLALARADTPDHRFDFEALREFLPTPAELALSPAIEIPSRKHR